MWEASSWGSLDYGGRWRALHHTFQTVLAPTVVSVWVDGDTVRVHGSHHGAGTDFSANMGGAGAGENVTTRVEVNVTDVATGVARIHRVVDGIDGKGSAVNEELLSIPLQNIDTAKEVVTTRLLRVSSSSSSSSSSSAGAQVAPIDTSETVHPLLVEAGGGTLYTGVGWVNVSIDSVSIAVPSITSMNASVVITNGAASPIFYALVTTTYEGRFSRNVVMVPPRSSLTTVFLFAAEVHGEGEGDAASFLDSLSIDWFNRAAVGAALG